MQLFKKQECQLYACCIFLTVYLTVVVWFTYVTPVDRSPSFGGHKFGIRNAYLSSELDTLQLPIHSVDEYFTLVNGSSCFKYGTDFRRSANGGKCECLPEHHGNDCSLPEVIWRAFIASRHGTVITRRSHAQRHIVLVSNGESIAHQATQLNELKEVVDLFVLPTVHDHAFTKGMEGKILVGESWQKAVRKLQPDALILHVPSHVVPLPSALLFFKLFDGFPQPVRFRMKWNVYGYFFQHPNRTRVYPETDAPLTIGDLNHYGGWFCDLCLDSLNTSMQDVVGDGLYSDKKTLLLRTHSSQPYYAPQFLINNSWQFESLLNNFYNKFDYN